MSLSSRGHPIDGRVAEPRKKNAFSSWEHVSSARRDINVHFFFNCFRAGPTKADKQVVASASHVVVNCVVLTAVQNASVVSPLGQITVGIRCVTTELARSGGVPTMVLGRERQL